MQPAMIAFLPAHGGDRWARGRRWAPKTLRNEGQRANASDSLAAKGDFASGKGALQMQDTLNSFHKILLFCALLAIAISALTLAPQASAQVLYGSLVGNVTDPNGAVVPNAAVTVTDQATGVATTTTTDSTGVFQF